MSDLYDADILAWSEQQALLLRRLAAGERVNDQVDWENVIDEVETVGRNELRAVKSHLIQALLHDLKAEAWPLSPAVSHWRAEARGHRGDAREAFTPSMRQKIDLAALYREALRRMPETNDSQAPLPVPAECPATLDELLAVPPD
jgi:Domain of unknown function DUF29